LYNFKLIQKQKLYQQQNIYEQQNKSELLIIFFSNDYCYYQDPNT